MVEPILSDNMEKALTELNLSITNNDINIEVSKEFLVELRKNIYHETYNEDVVDHIAKVLKMVDLICVPGVDSHQLRMKVFPLLLADDAKEWWISEGDKMLDEGENWGIDPLEFLSNINTSFKNNNKVNGRTQKVIFHSWMNENWNKRYVDNSILSNNELKESKYENPPNTATDSFFKAYAARDIETQCQTKRKYSNTSNSINEQANKRRCKAEKFEAIQYSLGPNEEYIAIRSYEYDIWERNKDNMSNIYQNIFQKRTKDGRVLYKVEDIATFLVEYVKFWDDWEVDRYGNANLATALRLCIAERSQAPEKVFEVVRFRKEAGGDDIRDLPVIDMAELVRLQICVKLDDTWSWVAPGPERQQVAAFGAPEAAKDAPVADEGAPAIPAPVRAPQPPPPKAEPARAMAQRLAKVEEDVQEI
ncbi:hypothetical protein Tco_1312813 [Tanacetum coccineum]